MRGVLTGFPLTPVFSWKEKGKRYPLFSGRVSVSVLVTVLLVKYIEGFPGESETVCYHAVRYASARVMLARTLPPDGERIA
jgi:hypothetical protein